MGNTQTQSPESKAVRYALGTFLAFIALNAFGGGIYGLSGAKAIPVEWLEGTPFRTYLIPSLILFAIVGGSCLLASIAVFARWAQARVLAFVAGVVLVGWISVQFAMIGFVSWMQPTMAIVGGLIAALVSMLWRDEESRATPPVGHAKGQF